jgi:hypothetical protein
MADGHQGGQQQGQQQHVRIDSLPTEKLDYLGKQLDREMAKMQQSASILSNLASEYQVSETAVRELKALEDGAPKLLYCDWKPVC